VLRLYLVEVETEKAVKIAYLIIDWIEEQDIRRINNSHRHRSGIYEIECDIFAFRLVSIHVGRRLVTQQAELLRVLYKNWIT